MFWTLLIFSVAGTAAAGPDLRLVEAARNRDRRAVQSLLKMQVDVNTPQADGATALHWAAHRDDRDIADLLIRAGANVNAVNDLGATPLLLACENANPGLVQLLIDAGAKPNVALSTGKTALMTAVRTGNADVVQLLVGHGADVNAREALGGQTALMWASASGHLGVTRALIETGADVHARSKSGFTPLLFAARAGDLELVRLLVARGADANETASDGSSALLVATVRGHVDVATLLLDAGANPSADGAGYTALHWVAGTWPSQLTGSAGIVAESGEWSRLAGLEGAAQIRLIKALLAHGANPNARLTKSPPRIGFSGFALNLTGATPFLLAAMGDGTVMRLLAAAGADPHLATEARPFNPNVPCIGGGSGACLSRKTTPLMVAAGFGRVLGESLVPEIGALEAVKVAVALGGDVNATDEAGHTAMHAAASWGADSIVRFLADRGASVSVKNKIGESPLMFAEGNARVSFTHTVYKSTSDLLRKLGAEN